MKQHDWYRDQCQACGAVDITKTSPECDPPYLGHSVRNRGTSSAELVYSSVSQLETASTCLRKWYYEKVKGIRREQSQAQIAGDALHRELKDYLRTGVNTLSPLAMSGKHLLPTPGADLFVEQEISGVPRLTRPTLYLDGVPFIGSIDLMHVRGENKGANDFEDVRDPDGTVEICDHKSAKSMAYALNGSELRASIQMNGYGVYASLKFPEARDIRLSHHYFITGKKQPAVKSTVLVPVEEIRETWESFTPLIRSIKDAAKQSNVENIEPNTRSCEKFGGCPHRSYCPYGNPLARFLESDNMGLLDKITKPATTPALPPTAPAADTLAAMNELAAKEVRSYTPAGFADACKILDASEFGWPPLNGKAARCRALILGHGLTQNTIAYQGTKQLVSIPAQTDPDVIVALAEDMCAKDPELRARALGNVTPAPILAPDAPKSDPTKASAGSNLPPPMADPQFVQTDETDQSGRGDQETAALENTSKVGEGSSGETQPTVKKRGRPPGSKSTHSADTINTVNVSDGLTLYIDCIEHPAAQSLHPMIDSLVSAILDRYKNGNGERAVDIRCANHDALSFGKWRGVLAALAVESIHSGTYSAHTMNCDIVQTVLTALRPIAGVYVRGA